MEKKISNFVRRIIDICGSGVGLVTLSPLFIIVAIAIKLDTSGPVFYRPKRVGKDGKLFRLFKFRSMVADAHKCGPGITVSGDNRVTRVGCLLRKTKIDELPQLINVFKGEMGLVGPRPEDPRYVCQYTPEQRAILHFRPGITSVASLTYRYEEEMLKGEDWEIAYRTQILPHKLSLDLVYLENRTVISDLRLIFKTIRAMFE